MKKLPDPVRDWEELFAYRVVMALMFAGFFIRVLDNCFD